MKVLLVEDDVVLADMVSQFLTSEGLSVQHLSCGADLLTTLMQWRPDLILLDLTLPDIDGIELCQQVRAEYSGAILILTARDEELAEIAALNMGADGYLTKPVRPHRLLAHIKALTRRQLLTAAIPTASQTIAVQDLKLLPQQRQVFQADVQLTLTDSEYEMLVLLMSQAGKVISREALFDGCGRHYDGLDRAVDMRISGLRRRLGDQQTPYRYIKTVRGQGYLFCS